MALSATQEFVSKLEKLEPGLFVFLMSSHPQILDIRYDDLASKVIIDLIEATGHMVNPLDVPEQWRSSFILQSTISQTRHLTRIGLHERVLERFETFIRGGQWNRVSTLSALRAKGYRGDNPVFKRHRDLEEEALNPDFNSW